MGYNQIFMVTLPSKTTSLTKSLSWKIMQN